jgi:UDP-N-acetylmuramoyl-L-alanyl-D-glutamate--2,6-diaminopimelate ligase
MAKVACLLSSKVILTSDNPRNEDPSEIINDMRRGVPATEVANVLAITDRKEAIRTAVMLMNNADILVIAGKGHETYQEINGIKSHFDDREIVKEVFKELN